MKRALGALAITLALLLAAATSALAQDDLPQAWQVQWENDTFAETDENYTNGLKITFIRDPEEISDLADRLARRWCARFCPELDYRASNGWTIGQNFYTPEAIELAVPQPGERPWAGWLYYGRLLQLTEFPIPGEPRRQHAFELDFGVVGPPALAEPVQKAVHEYITDSTKPRGWDNQVDVVPTISLNYVYRRILKTDEHFDVTPRVGANLGNVQTFANVGVTVRVGNNISGFPVSPISQTATQAVEREDREWYLFAGGEGRAVAYNVFLEGDGAEGGGVEPDSFVYDLQAGFAYRYKNWRLTYTFMRRSEEFPPPPGQVDGEHDFASLSFSFEPEFLE